MLSRLNGLNDTYTDVPNIIELKYFVDTEILIIKPVTPNVNKAEVFIGILSFFQAKPELDFNSIQRYHDSGENLGYPSTCS